jgi:uncharacterized protein YdhG (YjbR/CyaY superfamily)
MNATNKYKNVDAYIRTCPKETKVILEKIRETVKSAAPKSEETIKYQMPTLVLNGKNLLHFAAFKNHIGFYPIPTAIKAFQKELSPYKSAKGSVQFPLNEPIPYSLIKKIAVFRVKEVSKL